MESKKRRSFAMILAVMMVLSIAAGCKKEESPEGEESSSTSSEEKKSSKKSSSKSEPDSEYQVTVSKDNKTKMQEEKKKAKDVVAWLEVPNTTINEAVVQYKDDLAYFNANKEFYYERKDIYGQYLFDGCTFMDYTDDIKKGTKEDMPENTILYAHHIGNPKGAKNDPNSGGSFAPLLNFREKSFAEKTPYIYLTTESEDLIYQVFAVSDIEAVSEPLEYNYHSYKGKKWDGTDFKDSDFMTLIKDVRDRSYFDYKDVTVEDSDKILTLSTCVYDYGTYTANNQQRFVVFAKLVKNKNFAEKANVAENKDRKMPTYAK